MTIEDMEKEVPKKPTFIEKTFDYKCPNENCPNDMLGNGEYAFDRCEVCGQKIDWGELDDDWGEGGCDDDDD